MQRKQLTFVTVALLAATACTTESPTGVAPRAAGGPSLSLVTTASTPRLIDGNISGEGTAVCNDVEINLSGLARTGFKVDPPRTTSFNGYTFTLSADGRYLNVTHPSSSYPYTLVAVVMKGGPDTYVYDFPNGVSSVSLLRSPPTNSGNIPEISHYSACFTRPAWRLEKRVVGYWTDVTMVNFVRSNSVTFPAGCTGTLTQAQATAAGCIIWVQYEVAVTKIGGLPTDAAVVSDDMVTACGALGHARNFKFYCDYPVRNSLPWIAGGVSTTSSSTWTYIMDGWNKGDCGTYVLNNTATLTPTGGLAITEVVPLHINAGACSS